MILKNASENKPALFILFGQHYIYLYLKKNGILYTDIPATNKIWRMSCKLMSEIVSRGVQP